MSDWLEDLAILKSTLTLPEVVEMLGIEINSQGKITSPFNDADETPSCHIYEDHFFDYSTGRGGDILDFIKAVGKGRLRQATPSEVIEVLREEASALGKKPGDVERQAPRQLEDFTDRLADFDHYDCVPSAIRTFRDLNPPSNVRYSWNGGDPQLLIPHERDGRSYAVKVRSQSGAKSAWPGSQPTYSLYSPVGWEPTDLSTWTAIVCEGESDSWALEAALAPMHGQWVDVPSVFALPSGAGSWKDKWLEDLDQFRTVVVVMDNDKAGKDARDKLERKIGVLRVKHLFVPQLFNDVRQAVAAGWPVDKAIRCLVV